MSKVLTLRRLEPVELPDSWITLNEMTCVRNAPVRRYADERFVEISPIPEGYEVCDLEDATKVLIGETWCERSGSYFILNDAACPPSTIACLGVLAIRPIPKPEPLRGEVRVVGETGFERSGVAGGFPASLIGKTIRWEVVKDGEEL